MPRIKEKLPKELPHQVADDLLDDLNKTGRKLGEKLISALDDPLGKEGPHRSVDAVLDWPSFLPWQKLEKESLKD